MSNMEIDKELIRFGYVNTKSTAGSPERIGVMMNDITKINCWFNSFGNPSYCLHIKGGSTILCIDDYGCMNEITHLGRRVVDRKKDLFS